MSEHQQGRGHGGRGAGRASRGGRLGGRPIVGGGGITRRFAHPALSRGRNYDNNTHSLVGQIPGLPRLWFRDSRGNTIPPHKVTEFLEEIKKYTIRNYTKYLHNVFESPEGVYGEPEEPERPDDPDNVFEMETWKIQLKKYWKDTEDLDDDTLKLFGVMIGQMSSDSLEAIRQTETGAAALNNRDPLELAQAIMATHMTAGRIDDNSNLYDAEQAYYQLKMSPFESLDNYKKKFDAALTTFSAAAQRANQQGIVPPEAVQTQRFIRGLNENYSHYVDCFTRGMLGEPPQTIQAAVTAIVNHGPNNTRQNAANTRGVFATGRFRGGRNNYHRGGRGTGRRNFYNSPSSSRPCAICGSPKHWKNECPQRTEGAEESKDDEAEVVQEIKNQAKNNKKNQKNE
jgi:hypothetical protein